MLRTLKPHSLKHSPNNDRDTEWVTQFSQLAEQPLEDTCRLQCVCAAAPLLLSACNKLQLQVENSAGSIQLSAHSPQRSWPSDISSLSCGWKSRQRTACSGASPSGPSSRVTTIAGSRLLPAMTENHTGKISLPQKVGWEEFGPPARRQSWMSKAINVGDVERIKFEV